MAEEELFDVLIPPGVPRRLIIDIAKKFDVLVVERKMPMYFANMDGIEREILAFRGKREVIVEVEKYLKAELEKFIQARGFPERPQRPGKGEEKPA